MNTVLITGINGYLGANLAKFLLKRGYRVCGIVRPESDLTQLATVRSQITLGCYDQTVDSLATFFAEVKPQCVFHLASCFIAEHNASQITKLIDGNVLFGTHLLEAMSKQQVRCLVNTGTAWQHFNNELYNPSCLYAATKEAFAKIITYYVNAHNFRVITLELFDTYGKDDPRKKLIPALLRAMHSKEKLLFTKGDQEIDLVYVDDVMSAYMIAYKMLQQGYEATFATYALTTNQPKSLKEIVAIFEMVFATKLNIEWDKRPYRAREMMRVWNQGRTLPGWRACYDLASGLNKL